MAARKLGILVGGGPAPGINTVINSATIQALNCGFEVVGYFDGFKWLCSDRFEPAVHVMALDHRAVRGLDFEGGSVLRTSRTNLLDEEALKTSTIARPDAAKIARVLSNIRRTGVTRFLTIGGDDTALSARFLCEAAEELRVVHVPKTIDNDLPLPDNMPTFGFSTARFVGAGVVGNLMQDAQTTGRWYVVTAMGRTAGWLAMGIGEAVGAPITLIPEEFAERSTVQQITDVIEGAILKRRALGRPDGVAVIAEGLAYKLGDRAELERLLGREVPMDAAGHPRLSEVPLGDMLKRELQDRFRARGETSFTIVSHVVGYEMRSADPTPQDIAYCRALGYHSIRLFLTEEQKTARGVLVSISNGNLVAIDLHALIDPSNNRIRTRVIDTNSDMYAAARAFQTRLERADLEEPEMLARLAHEARLTPEEFRARFDRASRRLRDGESDCA